MDASVAETTAETAETVRPEELVTQSIETTSQGVSARGRKTKDPKKQEAGRKGAEARRQKMEALRAELAAAKEAVFYANNEESHPLEGLTGTVPASIAPKQEIHQQSVVPTGWVMGISLALIAGAVLFVYSSNNRANNKRDATCSSSSKTTRTEQKRFAALACPPVGKSLFDME